MATSTLIKDQIKSKPAAVLASVPIRTVSANANCVYDSKVIADAIKRREKFGVDIKYLSKYVQSTDVKGTKLTSRYIATMSISDILSPI